MEQKLTRVESTTTIRAMIQSTFKQESIANTTGIESQFHMDCQTSTLVNEKGSCFEIVVPTENDILLGRTRRAFTSKGNVRLREEIAAKLDAYNEAPTRREKTMVIRSVITSVLSSGGRFLKRVDPRLDVWCEASRTDARRRVGHAFRDACKPDKVKCMVALRKQIKSSKVPTAPISKISSFQNMDNQDDESSATSFSSTSVYFQETEEDLTTSIHSLTSALELVIDLDKVENETASSIYDPLPIEKILHMKPLVPLGNEGQGPNVYTDPVAEWQTDSNELTLDTVDMLLCAVLNES
mmetsp:Transcript_31352/g.44510  ORF Transcript_31352/g.44510 Transcript_31352/m.44510 type:complete len:297 (+) Transcript_31352:457-1347(+)